MVRDWEEWYLRDGVKAEKCPRKTGGGQKQELEEAMDTSLGIKKHVKGLLELLSQEQKLENARMTVVHNSFTTITSY